MTLSLSAAVVDGTVSISDFIDLAAHFNQSGATWQNGDVNYDGAVTEWFGSGDAEYICGFDRGQRGAGANECLHRWGWRCWRLDAAGGGRSKCPGIERRRMR